MTPNDLQVLIRTWNPVLRRQFLAAVANAGEKLSDTALVRAIRQKNVASIIKLIGDATPDLRAMEATIAQSFIAGAVEGAVALNKTHVALYGSLQQSNPLARVAAEFAGRRIVAVSLDTKAEVAQLIGNAFDQGVTVRDTATLIRNVVGLSPRDVGALNNFTDGLVEQGLGPTDIAARAARYGQTLLNRRATTIARTEIIDASAAGQQALWDHAVTTGVLSPNSQKVWIANDDACPDCDALDETVVGIGESFEGPDGPLDGPTVHPNCECTVGLASEEAG